MLLSILVYGYATGVFSSRKLEHATYDSVAFRFVAADEHPDHDTLNSFRKRFLKEIEGLMLQVLLIAHALGVAKLGNVALDGSKIVANASKHSALSYGHIKKLETQLKAEVAKLLALAEAADNEKIPAGLNLPDEIARRCDRLKAIAAAKTKIEARAKERFEQEQAEYTDKLAKREARATDSGKTPRGKAPDPLDCGSAGMEQEENVCAGGIIPLGYCRFRLSKMGNHGNVAEIFDSQEKIKGNFNSQSDRLLAPP